MLVSSSDARSVHSESEAATDGGGFMVPRRPARGLPLRLKELQGVSVPINPELRLGQEEQGITQSQDFVVLVLTLFCWTVYRGEDPSWHACGERGEQAFWQAPPAGHAKAARGTRRAAQAGGRQV